MPEARYAETVQADGFYLGLLDLAVLCQSYGKQGIVIFRERDLQIQVQPLQQLIEQSLKVSGFVLPENWLTSPDAEKWHFLSVRCDYQPSHHGECNHWLPIWTQEDLGDEFEVHRHSRLSNLHDAIYTYTQKVQELTVDAEDSQDEEGARDMELDSLLEQIAQYERQLQCFQALLDAGFCPREVPADGNCGLWSLMCLRQGGCFGSAEDAAQQMKEERRMLGRAWSHCSVNILWQQLWKHFGMEAELTADEIASAKCQPKTPPRGEAAAKRVWLDEMSPLKHMDPKKISGCKPPMMGKPQDPSRLQLQQPGKKREKPTPQKDKQTGETEDADENKVEADEDWLGGEWPSSCGVPKCMHMDTHRHT